MMFLLLLCVGVSSCGGEGGSQKEGSRSGEKKITGDDVKKELGEAVATTKVFLEQRKGDLINDFDKRMRAVEEKLDILREKVVVTGEKGRERLEQEVENLQVQQEAVRGKFEEFKSAGEEYKDAARERLETAIKDLERAYQKTRDSFGKDNPG